MRPRRETSRSIREPDHARIQAAPHRRGCACAIAGCNSKATDEAPAATPVRIVAATSGPAAPSIRTNGLLANKDEIRLAFKVGGVIRRLAVSEGEHVRKGQKLAEIEQTEVNAQVEQARQAHEKAQRDAGARRTAVRGQGHQPRTAAGSAHAGRDGRSGTELRRVQLELRRDRRAARRHGAAPARGRTRAGLSRHAGARARRAGQGLRRAHRPGGSRDRAGASRRRCTRSGSTRCPMPRSTAK